MSDKTDKQLAFCGIDKYHQLGYRGNGIVIFNHELDEEGKHGEMTTDVLQLVAPEATIINGKLKCYENPRNPEQNYFFFEMSDGERLTPLEIYYKYKPDVISVSFAGRSDYKELQMKPLIDRGCIVFCASGNEGDDGVDARYEHIAILCGSAYIDVNDNVRMASYSGYDIDKMSVDLTGFMGEGSGTSAGCPFVAGQCALILQKYGKMNQADFMQFIEGKTYDIYADGDDVRSGKGILIMPEDKVSNFSDVDVNDWYAESIEYCRAKGYISGFEDGTFKPNDNLTRAQIATILYNYDKSNNV